MMNPEARFQAGHDFAAAAFAAGNSLATILAYTVPLGDLHWRRGAIEFVMGKCS